MNSPNFATSRRNFLAGTGLFAVTVFAAGCSTGTQAAPSGTTSFAGQELNVLLISSHEGAAKWLSEEYEKRTGAKVNPTIVPYDEIGATLALDQQSGANKFDAAAPWYVSLGDLASDGSIKDLTDWIGTDIADADDFIPSINDPYTLVDGRRYGLAFDGDTHVLFYNKEILSRNGFSTPPATWDEYIEQSKTITENEGRKGTYGAAVFGQKSPLILGASFANRLAGFGGAFLDESGKPALNTDAAIGAAENLIESAKYAFPTATETDFGVGNGAWFDGKVGFIENWTDLGVGSEVNEDSKVAGKWGVTTLPVGGDNKTPRASLVAGFTWVIAGNTEKEELARDFIKWATSSQVNEALLTSEPPTGIDPNRKSSLESSSYEKAYPELQKVNRTTLQSSLAWPTGSNASEAAQVMTDELSKLLSGQGGTAKETLDRIQSQWESILG
ncbi:multiple sugar transport system substrate-binding protein [Neomicrococcus aestuarii]|uniref:Multiple sugar transport system substrate-binding protein n=1 Tax=Neomicrococcus aestuarii TaxID=556325 RepID=A0A7W8X189_9MICC|nr:sugar ABC transporter substrate-binding protein [Neomicrococcus aestuarii]MBB5513663.1 multiple sugar transport system substrate-binding protein [Neomicrococcus aestuarii]